jgi:hypothetical protein
LSSGGLRVSVVIWVSVSGFGLGRLARSLLFEV